RNLLFLQQMKKLPGPDQAIDLGFPNLPHRPASLGKGGIFVLLLPGRQELDLMQEVGPFHTGLEGVVDFSQEMKELVLFLGGPTISRLPKAFGDCSNRIGVTTSKLRRPPCAIVGIGSVIDTNACLAGIPLP